MKKTTLLFLMLFSIMFFGCKQIYQTIYKSSFTVTFDPGDGSGEMECQTFFEDQEQCLSKCTFKAPEGCFFNCWTVAAQKEPVKYSDGQSIKLTKNIKLIANWTWEEYFDFPLVKNDVPLYLYDYDENKYLLDKNLTLYFPTIFQHGQNTGKQVPDIPYVNLLDKYFFNFTYLSFKQDGDISCFYDENSNESIEFNIADNTLYISDLSSLYPLNLAKNYEKEGKSRYLKLEELTTYKRKGNPIEINLNTYGIEVFSDQDGVYIPLALFNTLFDENHIYTGNKLLKPTTSDIYGASKNDFAPILYDNPRKRSPQLINHNYNELCLLFDYFYGNKNEKNISSFDNFFKRTGLELKLKSEDAVTATNAIQEFTCGVLEDNHNRYYSSSPFGGSPYSETNDSLFSFDLSKGSFSYLQYWQAGNYLKQQRVKYNEYFYDDYNYADYGKAKDCCQIVNNDTLFLTVEESIAPKFPSYYEKKDDAEFWNNPSNYNQDTFGLIFKAHKMLMEEYNKNPEDRKIKQIVIDLSLGAGGSDAAASALLAWILGEGEYVNKYVNCDGEVGQKYLFDANLDGNFYDRVKGIYISEPYNNDDCLQCFTKLGKYPLDIQIYVLISQFTFSNGGYLAHVLENTMGEITLMGQKSNGGSCNLKDCVSADGTFFGMSSFTKAGVYRNDGFVSYETGTRAPVQISPELFYDRARFAKWLGNYAKLDTF